jgi:Ca2+-binding RTX toxin-like protein
LSLQKNGVGPVFAHPSSVEGNGGSSLTLHYSGLSLAPEDWVMISYTATAATNGFRDAAGNVMLAEDDDQPFAEGGSGANTIDLSGLSAGHEAFGNAGNDAISGSTGDDQIQGGSGADVLTGNSGNDDFDFEQGDSPVVAFADAAGVGLGTGDTFIFAGGQADLITDFGIGDEISFDTRLDDSGVLRDPAWMATPSDGLASDQGFFMVQGYFAAGVFTVDSATGADTLLVYDGDDSAAVTQTGIVLTGVTPSQLDLFDGGGSIHGV